MIKKYPTLSEINAEEKQLMELIESDNYVPPTDELTPEKVKNFQAIARATLNEERTKISLRLRSSDLRRLKERASKEGMPYQTLIGSILHKAVSWGHWQVPDTVKFIFVVGLIAGAIYGTALALASFPPEQSEIIKTLPHEKLRQK